MTTIYDVARRAEVSIGTVSRVLNGHPSVRPLTRRAVLSAIEALGYHPNAIARHLVAARTQTIGMLAPNLTNPMNVQLIQGAEEAALKHGYTLIFGDAHDEESIQARHLQELLERRIDGLLCYAVGSAVSIRKAVTAAGVPTVLLNRLRPDPELSAVIIDEQAAFAEAVRDLIALGHRRIGMIVKSQVYSGGFHRLRAFRSNAGGAGIPPAAELICEVDSDAACRAAVETILNLAQPPTALIAGSHGLTPACLEVLWRRGCRIPETISLLTFGDSDWARAYNPPLSAVAVDSFASAQAAAELLIREIAGEAGAAEVLTHQAAYIRRHSCGPATIPASSCPGG